MQTKTLGGDRLGSGKKMQIELHGYERSTHNLSTIWRSSMAAGTLVPFYSRIMLPGDTFDINLECDVKTLPTIGPLFGSYKVQLDVFSVPIRLYNSLLHNNKLGIGLDMSQVKLPQIQLPALPTIEGAPGTVINPSSLLAYLGIRGIGSHGEGEIIVRNFNAVPILAYWDIYKNYYANKQEKIGAFIATDQPESDQTIDTVTVTTPVDSYEVPEAPDTIGGFPIDAYSTILITYTGAAPNLQGVVANLQSLGAITMYDLVGGMYNDNSGTITAQVLAQYAGDTVESWAYAENIGNLQVKPTITTFPLENIDEMREEILAYNITSTPFRINVPDIQPYSVLYDPSAIKITQTGLGLKTYQSDLFNNWLDAEYMDAISDASAVSTVGDSFTIDQLNLSQKIYEMLNRIAVSGGTYNDWIDAAYGIRKTRMAESPMYMGGLSKELVFQEVVSNTETDTQPLGTLAGRGRLAEKHKGGYIDIRVEEPSYVIGIVSLTPRVDYSQGNDWQSGLQTLDDLHKPGLDQIGFQDLIQEQMAWWTTSYEGGQ